MKVEEIQRTFGVSVGSVTGHPVVWTTDSTLLYVVELRLLVVMTSLQLFEGTFCLLSHVVR